MRVEPLVPDRPTPTPAASGDSGQRFAELVDAVGGALRGADAAERAFVAQRGGLEELVVERARADIALQIAAAGAQRVAQSLQTLLGLQV